MLWTICFVSDTAEEEVAALPEDMKARFLRIGELIQNFGPAAVHEPHIKHLTGKLWEIRMKGRDGIARSIYVTASERRVVVLRTFVKKTNKTPRQEIEIALFRAKDVS